MRTAAVLIAALALLGGVAEARPFGSVEREHAGIALRHWGPLPCPNGVAYWIAPDAYVDAQTRAPGALAMGTGMKASGYCEVALAERLVGGGTYSYADRCVVMLHEVGHAANRGHSADPHDPMFPEFRPDGWQPMICLRAAHRRENGCDRKRTERAVERCYTRWGLG